jgi:hypothetical protein
METPKSLYEDLRRAILEGADALATGQALLQADDVDQATALIAKAREEADKARRLLRAVEVQSADEQDPRGRLRRNERGDKGNQ